MSKIATMAIGGLIVIVGLANAIEKSRVPLAVYIPKEVSVSKWNDGLVSFRGTKQIEGEPVKLGILETSLVECRRQDNQCVESIGEISGGYLSISMVHHKILNWDEKSITFVDSNACRDDVFKIDRSAQLPSGQRAPKSDAHKNCSGVDKKAVRLMFSDSAVLWAAERAKYSARTGAGIGMLLLLAWVIYRVWHTFKDQDVQ